MFLTLFNAAAAIKLPYSWVELVICTLYAACHYISASRADCPHTEYAPSIEGGDIGPPFFCQMSSPEIAIHKKVSYARRTKKPVR